MFRNLLAPHVIWAARPAALGETGWVGNWSPGIGDPSVLGWVTVVAYFASAWLCYRVVTRLAASISRSSSLRVRESWLWRAFFVLLIVLGVNKQLDLQSAITVYFRSMAQEEAWYDGRRTYQVAFIAGVAILGVIVGISLVAVTRQLARPVKIAGLGLCFVGAFVLIRATSFHEMDSLIRYQIVSLRLNGILELGGIATICAGAARRICQLRGSTP